MVIHTVKSGETLYQISKMYGVSPAKIIENNGIKNPDRLSVGKKLLILTPTKSYTVRGGDTLEKIARRFGVTSRDLKRRNPYLSEKRGTYAEQVIAIKYDTPPHSCTILNGYYYRDTPKERLNLALAVADLITVSAYTVKDGRLKRFFNDHPVTEAIKSAGRSAIMRIYAPERTEVIEKGGQALEEDIIESAKNGGYSGICLSAWELLRDYRGRDLISHLKRRANDEGLTLTVECDGPIPDISSLSDRCVLEYEKCILDAIPSFDDGERKFYTEYAEKCEPSCTFIDIPSLGYIGNEAAGLDEIDAVAYRYGKEVLYDEDKKICYFDLIERGREKKRAVMESPENIIAKLGLLSSLGFMGMTFDIMRIPVAYLMIATNTFADTYSSSPDI